MILVKYCFFFLIYVLIRVLLSKVYQQENYPNLNIMPKLLFEIFIGSRILDSTGAKCLNIFQMAEGYNGTYLN